MQRVSLSNGSVDSGPEVENVPSVADPHGSLTSLEAWSGDVLRPRLTLVCLVNIVPSRVL
jgi:hypothetical protein